MTELEWLQCGNPHLMLEHVASTKRAARWPLLSWLGILRDKENPRRSLLFAIACCRRIEHLLVDRRSRYALEMVEKLADGKAARRDRALAVAAAEAAVFDASSPRVGVGGWLAAAQARAAEAVAATLAEPNPANVAAARAKEAVRAQAKARPLSDVGISSAMPCAEISWNSALIVANAPPGPVVPSEETAWNNEAAVQCELLRDIFGNPFRPVSINRHKLQKSAAVPIARRIYEERTFNHLTEIADVLSSEGIDHPDLLAHCRQARDHVRGCWAIDLLLGR